jgi:hypothetical protein
MMQIKLHPLLHAEIPTSCHIIKYLQYMLLCQNYIVNCSYLQKFSLRHYIMYSNKKVNP